MKKFILAILASLCIVSAARSAQDTTYQYRSFHYPSWCQRPLDDSNYGLPPWYINYAGVTNIVFFCNGNLTQSAPYFTGLRGGADSVEFHYGPAGGTTHYLDSLIAIGHRNGVKLEMTIQAVSPNNLDYIIADSARTQTFFNNFVPWLLRKGFDGWSLNYEGGSPNILNMDRFFRIGDRTMRAMYGSRPYVISVATPRGSSLWYVNSKKYINRFDIETSSFSYVWNGSANVTYHQTPNSIDSACASCNLSALDHEFGSGLNEVAEWGLAGIPPSKISIGWGVSVVGGFLGANQLLKPYNNQVYDIQLYDAERMTQYGGIKVTRPQAMASYIAGTATAGNPVGLSVGMKFFFPFSDSTSIKQGLNHMAQFHPGGVWIYDAKGDMRPGQSIKLPYIYAAMREAMRINGGSIPPPPSPVISNYDSVTIGATQDISKIRFDGRDTTIVAHYRVTIDRPAEHAFGATVTVTPKQFIFVVPQGVTHLDVTIPDSIRIQK